MASLGAERRAEYLCRAAAVMRRRRFELAAWQVRVQQVPGVSVPYQFFLMAPYILSILAMIVMSRKALYPKALLVPFRRGERT